jgi:hypothetical protein
MRRRRLKEKAWNEDLGFLPAFTNDKVLENYVNDLVTKRNKLMDSIIVEKDGKY